MNSIETFQLTLNFQESWHIENVKFEKGDESIKKFHIEIKFKRGLGSFMKQCVVVTVVSLWQSEPFIPPFNLFLVAN